MAWPGATVLQPMEIDKLQMKNQWRWIDLHYSWLGISLCQSEVTAVALKVQILSSLPALQPLCPELAIVNIQWACMQDSLLSHPLSLPLLKRQHLFCMDSQGSRQT